MTKPTPSDRRITVLQLCEHFGGRDASLHGVARSFQWWMPAFDTVRYRVLLCSRKGRDKAALVMEQAGLSPLYLGFGAMDPRNLFSLLKILRRESVDIIHAHGYGACTWGRVAGLLTGTPVIVHERCNTHTVPWFQRPVEWLLGRFTRHALAVSESTRQFCIHGRYLRPEAVQVLYNGMLLQDMPRMTPDQIQAFRREQGAGPDALVIGVVGRLESHKGHRDAFQALQVVLERYPRAVLWVVGDGTYGDVLRRLVQELKLDDRVKFLGFRADARQIIQCFDIQLFPSHMEGTPNTLYEALAAGNAIVASTADGQGEILKDNDTALLFVPGDVPVMADQLIRLAGDPALAVRLRAAARRRADDFDGRRTISTMQALYDRIMAARDASTHPASR